MEVVDLVNDVISLKNQSITDEVFLLIQENREFMQKYLQLVHEKGSDVVNRQIGKLVAKKYQLTSDESRNNSPRSSLIFSHQQFD